MSWKSILLAILSWLVEMMWICVCSVLLPLLLSFLLYSCMAELGLFQACCKECADWWSPSTLQ